MSPQWSCEDARRASTLQGELVRQLVESTPAGVAMFDRDMRYIVASRRFLRDYGVSEQDITGRSHYEIFPEIPDRWKDVHRRCLAGATERADSDRFVRADGRVDLVTWEIQPWYGHEREIAGVILFSEVVTSRERERSRAAEQLRETEQRFDATFEQAAVGIAHVAPDGSWLRVNRRLCEIVGYGRDELLTRTFQDITHPDDLEADLGYVAQVLAGALQTYSMEKRYLRKDGAIVWINLTVSLVRTRSGEPDYFIAVVEDINERKRAELENRRLEEQLWAAQKMDAIGNLAGGVAHDFNNLLSVILNYTEFALQGMRDGDPLRAELHEVKRAGERAAELTRQLLAFGRRQVLRPAPTDLGEVTRALERMLRRILGADIELDVRSAPDLGLAIVDRGQMEQVIMNLAANARDAMPEGGKLTFEISNVDGTERPEAAVRAGAETTTAYVRLAVADTGRGMEEATRARCFEPFFTTKEQGKGTGLGLATVYGIVAQSSGRIAVHSAPGRGTRFEIDLPRTACAATSLASESPAARVAGGNETILVVDDEALLRRLAQRILTAAGYTVLLAESGAEALSVSQRHEGEIHLVLSDVVMPQMSGKQLYERLRQTRPTTRVLFMSGYSADATAHADPAMPLIEKPFGATGLTKAIRELLR